MQYVSVFNTAMKRAHAIVRQLRTPEARVRWCLTFASRDLAELPVGQRSDAGRVLVTMQGQPWPVMPPHPDAIAETHRHLHDCIEALANRCHYTVATPAVVWQLLPPPDPSPHPRRSGLISRRSSANLEPKHLPSMAVLAFVDDLNSIGADRLRACRLVDDGKHCGEIFLAQHRRALYCMTAHARRAAWLNYEPIRKKNRED
jgi:hypothetical protein